MSSKISKGVLYTACIITGYWQPFARTLLLAILQHLAVYSSCLNNGDIQGMGCLHNDCLHGTQCPNTCGLRGTPCLKDVRLQNTGCLSEGGLQLPASLAGGLGGLRRTEGLRNGGMLNMACLNYSSISRGHCVARYSALRCTVQTGCLNDGSLHRTHCRNPSEIRITVWLQDCGL